LEENSKQIRVDKASTNSELFAFCKDVSRSAIRALIASVHSGSTASDIRSPHLQQVRSGNERLITCILPVGGDIALLCYALRVLTAKACGLLIRRLRLYRHRA
jgi:hypothetical protein